MITIAFGYYLVYYATETSTKERCLYIVSMIALNNVYAIMTLIVTLLYGDIYMKFKALNLFFSKHFVECQTNDSRFLRSNEKADAVFKIAEFHDRVLSLMETVSKYFALQVSASL